VILLIDPAALAELQEALAFYIAHSTVALGGSFVAEFERAVNLIVGNPSLGSVRRNGLRQYALRRFPYSVIYQVTPEQLRIIAVAHQRRKPGYWSARK
jgi:toxin ParE1/3/4